MRITKTPDGGLKVWLSANDTYQWATRPGASWPCSALESKVVFAEFDGKGDLVDHNLVEKGLEDCSGDEFNACLTDHIASKYPDHPALRGEPQPIS